MLVTTVRPASPSLGSRRSTCARTRPSRDHSATWPATLTGSKTTPRTTGELAADGDGDTLVVEISGVGRLTNTVVETPDAAQSIGHRRTDSAAVKAVALGSDLKR